MVDKLKETYALELLVELQSIYCKEGGRNFDAGISAAIASLADKEISEKDRWSQACSIYQTMAVSKSGFSDFYIDRDTVEQRINANARLDFIRQELWKLLGY